LEGQKTTIKFHSFEEWGESVIVLPNVELDTSMRVDRAPTMRQLLVLSLVALAAVTLSLSRPASAFTADSGSFAFDNAEASDAAPCPLEAMRRIALCTKILRVFLDADESNAVPWIPRSTRWSSSSLCRDLRRDFPSTVDYSSCQTVAGHVFGAAGSEAPKLTEMTRDRDIHDVCTNLLAREFPQGSGQRMIDASHAEQCSFPVSGGVTGLRCLMLHGLGGQRLSYRGHPQSQPTTLYSSRHPFDGFLGRFKRYWSVESELDGICDVRFYVSDTIQRGWDNEQLQAEYCAAIQTFNPHVIVTHSMGNMIVAAGFAKRIQGCYDRISKNAAPNKAIWLSVQAPWTGSPLAKVAVDSCSKKKAKPANLWNRFKKWIVTKIQKCGSSPATTTLAPAYKSRGSIQLGDLKGIAASMISGQMCGIDNNPLATGEWLKSRSLSLWLSGDLGSLIGLIQWGLDKVTSTTPEIHGNDGAVAFHDCDLQQHGIRYGFDYHDPFYAAMVSHEDGTCAIKDDPRHGLAKQPCSWYATRIQSVRQQLQLPTQRSAAVELVNPSATYMPFAHYTYPRSFLQLEHYMSVDQVDAMDALEEAVQRAKAESQDITKEEQQRLIEEFLASRKAQRRAQGSLASNNGEGGEEEAHAHLESHSAASNSASLAAEAEQLLQSELENGSEHELSSQVDHSHDSDFALASEVNSLLKDHEQANHDWDLQMEMIDSELQQLL